MEMKKQERKKRSACQQWDGMDADGRDVLYSYPVKMSSSFGFLNYLQLSRQSTLYIVLS